MTRTIVVKGTHNEEHLRTSDFITDVVIGMSDGLTVPFALAAGLSGAVQSNSVVITAGIAEIFAGSIALGLGGYLAGKTKQEHYQSEPQQLPSWLQKHSITYFRHFLQFANTPRTGNCKVLNPDRVADFNPDS